MCKNKNALTASQFSAHPQPTTYFNALCFFLSGGLFHLNDQCKIAPFCCSTPTLIQLNLKFTLTTIIFAVQTDALFKQSYYVQKNNAGNAFA